MRQVNIALDGPSGAGKSSVAKECAKQLGLIYIDTGAMYRAAALYAIENGIPIERDALLPHLDGIHIDIRHVEGSQHIFLNGRDVSERIREADASIGSSNIAVIPEVRAKLVELQRELARNNSVVMDGRDIGTNVLPDADLKIFLTASLDVRAKRRYRELQEKGMGRAYEAVKQDMAYRDENDSKRECAPLCMAEDAVLIDSSDMTFEEVVRKIAGMISKL
ncbi:MAG TPA: (d)CMP kinase [Candidatus Avimonoglobus intestinipullorum]|uniref:Cytidylate kinase n=1 Tax=Candidatus Avimonoglobus intestinipullorum TaxID=2840699 RepID=A0A9D1S709_9FIRM|nr:(d)CMP kinase [Candidatus Avimonoglobus intestinipullorum]